MSPSDETGVSSINVGDWTAERLLASYESIPGVRAFLLD